MPKRASRVRVRSNNDLAEFAGLDSYQTIVSDTIHGQDDVQRRLHASMLGLSSETGSVLDAYKRYLRDSIDLSASREFLREELGDLLWYIAAVGTSSKIKLSLVAKRSLQSQRNMSSHAIVWKPSEVVSRQLVKGVVRSTLISIGSDFSSFQHLAVATTGQRFRGPIGPLLPMFDLAGAVGSILSLASKRGNDVLKKSRAKLIDQLGKLLRVVGVVAKTYDLDLGEIAVFNISRSRDLYAAIHTPQKKLFAQIPRFDDPKEPKECLPRKLVIRFEERSVPNEPSIAVGIVVLASPNAFPRGPVKHNGKLQGFSVGKSLGQMTTDNSRREDGYRFHDAIHLAFAAVLGWSPVVRRLLRLKRKSKPSIDRDEDGARAIFTEEGLAALLSRLASRRMNFLGENTVDGQVIAVVQAATRDIEAQKLPGWLWRRAISQGFRAMAKLRENKGGFLFADLDARELTYSKTQPDV